jgi:hypothetical protein
VRPRVWWWLWIGFVVSPVALYFLLIPSDQPPPDDSVAAMGELVPLFPLALSVMARWLVLPLCRRHRALFAVFLTGLVLGLVTTLLAVLWGESLSRQLFYAGLLAIVQFVPLFSLRSRSSP